ncbi:MAG: hypothetical protein U0792_13275 [Gemmataceae bacterium]
MEKFAAPLMVVLAIGAYYLVNEQFRKVQQNMPQGQFKVNPVQIPQPVMPPIQFKPIQPFNPFAEKAEEPEPAEDNFTPTPFETANGYCKAVFPGGKPKVLSFPLFGVKVTRAMIRKQVATFEVSYYDSNWREGTTAGTPRQWLAYRHARQLEAMHAREEIHRPVMFEEVIPGIEFEALFLKDNKPQMWVGKTYLIGQDIYTASVYGDASVVALRGPEFLKFFTLTDKAAQAAK